MRRTRSNARRMADSDAENIENENTVTPKQSRRQSRAMESWNQESESPQLLPIPDTPKVVRRTLNETFSPKPDETISQNIIIESVGKKKTKLIKNSSMKESMVKDDSLIKVTNVIKSSKGKYTKKAPLATPEKENTPGRPVLHSSTPGSMMKSIRKTRLLINDANLTIEKKNVTFHSPANVEMSIIEIDEQMQSEKKKTRRRKRSFSNVEGTTAAVDDAINESTPHKRSKSATTPTAKAKVPNFAEIHRKNFEKMESIVEHVNRRKKRAETLSATKKFRHQEQFRGDTDVREEVDVLGPVDKVDDHLVLTVAKGIEITKESPVSTQEICNSIPKVVETTVVEAGNETAVDLTLEVGKQATEAESESENIIVEPNFETIFIVASDLPNVRNEERNEDNLRRENEAKRSEAQEKRFQTDVVPTEISNNKAVKVETRPKKSVTMKATLESQSPSTPIQRKKSVALLNRQQTPKVKFPLSVQIVPTTPVLEKLKTSKVFIAKTPIRKQLQQEKKPSSSHVNSSGATKPMRSNPFEFSRLDLAKSTKPNLNKSMPVPAHDNSTQDRQQRRMAMYKSKPVSPKSKTACKPKSTLLRGVRTNRRFDLQMQFRQLNDVE